MALLETLDTIHRDLGLPEYTGAWVEGKKSMTDVLAITMALMIGTAGLPHVLIRFYTVPNARAARWSAMWALIFIGLLYTTAPAVSAFARVNMIETLNQKPYADASSMVYQLGRNRTHRFSGQKRRWDHSIQWRYGK